MPNRSPLSWLVLRLAVVTALLPWQALTAATSAIVAAGAGEHIQAPDLVSDAEVLRFDGAFIPSLLALAPETEVLIDSWPVSPTVRQSIIVTRHEVYAPDAHLYHVDGGRTVEIPRSRLAFFWGVLADDPKSGVAIAIDPDHSTVEATTQHAGGTFALRPLVPGQGGRHIVARDEAFVTGLKPGQHPTWKCGASELPGYGLPILDQSGNAIGGPEPEPRHPDLLKAQELPGDEAAPLDGPIFSGSGANLKTATLAIDTDPALLSVKFGNSTTTASNYIASMVATINVMYNRDLQIQLVIGSETLRTGPDPYNFTGGIAGANDLNTFGTYWANNNGTIKRTVATMLSGKGAVNEASGIAWVSGLCSTTYGYNFVLPFLNTGTGLLSFDSLIVGHEIGHNFGSRHTHCYQLSPNVWIDQCYNQEQGCYSGPESCPAPTTVNGVTNVEGTVMGYCHLLGGCTSSMVFHPYIIGVIQPNIQAALNVCISPPPPSVSLTSVSPQSGAAGTVVTLTGTGFNGTSPSVHFGNSAATIQQVVSDTSIVVTVPAGSGAVAVSVADSNGSATLTNGFFYFAPTAAAGFYQVPPCRVLDTRSPSPNPLAAGENRLVTITGGSCGIPTSAVAVSANVTIVTPSAPGVLSAYPGNAFPLQASTLNFAAGDTRPNNTLLTLATDGTGRVGMANQSSGTTHLIIDINGYFL